MGDFVARVEQDGDRLLCRSLFDTRSAPAAAGLSPGAIVTVSDDAVELVAEPRTALARVYEVMGRHQVDPFHGPELTAELEAIQSAPGLDDPALRDLLDLPFVTIDNADSRDLDQALFVERTATGFVVWYALADAAHYVRPGTALFREALKRGASFYMPSVSAPMLPPQLSEGLVSLNPGVVRRALALRMIVDADGRCEHTEVIRARIQSRAKLAYDGVQAAFDRRDLSSLSPNGAEFEASLLALQAFGEVRARRARARGVIHFGRLEGRLLAEPGQPRFTMRTRDRNDVERYNEELSLLANMEGAKLLAEMDGDGSNSQPVFRVHLPPDDSRLEELSETLAEIVRAQGLGNEWNWRRAEESLASYLARLPSEPERMRRAIERQARYTFHASEFRARVGPHHALAVDGYARVSSPMREIVGVFTHKELLEGLRLVPDGDRALDESLREAVIDAGNSARRLQRKLEKEVGLFAIDDLLREDLELDVDDRPWRVGTVLGIRSTRINVGLDVFPIDLKLYRDDIESRHGCQYVGSAVEMRPISGRGPTFRVGSPVRLRTLEWDDRRNRFVMEADSETTTSEASP